MNPSDRPGWAREYRIPIVICVAAALLIVGILLLKGGSDSPVVQEIVPPVPTAATGTTSPEATVIDPSGREVAATEGAIDGKGVTAAPKQPVNTDPHGDGAISNPSSEATDVGPYVETATRYAQISLNRPTDVSGSRKVNSQLVKLSTGSLARDLAKGTGDVQTAQVAAVSSVVKAIPLALNGDYAEVLIVAKQQVTDPGTGEPLDPKYLNFVVRLEKVPGGSFAVTSWEPQL